MTSFDRGFSGTPRWSPDGRWIAFDHHHETHSQIYLIDSEGPNMHAVTFPDASVGAVIVIQRPGCQKSIKKNWCVRIPFAVADEVLW
jgi:tricorn protease-like protein